MFFSRSMGWPVKLFIRSSKRLIFLSGALPPPGRCMLLGEILAVSPTSLAEEGCKEPAPKRTAAKRAPLHEAPPENLVLGRVAF
jgi:hypothetical protein